jgi:hypothetical protein
MAEQRRRYRGGELRKVATAPALYLGLIASVGYGVFAAATHPALIDWLSPDRLLGIVAPKPPMAESPHASLPPKLRGAVAE